MAASEKSVQPLRTPNANSPYVEAAIRRNFVGPLHATCHRRSSSELQRSRTGKAESGLPGYAFDSWIGLLAPAGTPKADIERLNAATNKVLAEPAIQERFKRLGVEPRSQTAEEFQKLLRADWDAMGAVVKASGAKVD